jgi:putative FmdB family regulatory protein
MPKYEYVCRTCGHRLEIWQSFTDDPLTICDECGGELRKVFTAPSISFKGSGFYATDHGRKGRSAEKESTTSEKGSSTSEKESKSSEKESTSSEGAKPAPKAEPAASETASGKKKEAS